MPRIAKPYRHHSNIQLGTAPEGEHSAASRNHLGGKLDILLALKGRGFLLQDGDVPPRGYCELH